MKQTFEMSNGDKVAVERVAGGYVAREQESFEEYVKQNIMTRGGYDGWKHIQNGVAVAEFDDGMGFILGECLENAVEDENVEVDGISDGWLHLKDRR